MGLDAVLALAVVASGLGAALAGALAWRRGAPGGGPARIAGALGAVALVAAVVAWAVRWRSAGHLPVFGTWESALSLSVAVLAVPVVAARRLRPALWPASGLLAAVLIVHAFSFDPTAYALTISERSLVVDVHAVVAWAAGAALAANAGLAAACLLARETALPRLHGPLASALSAGFLLHSAMLATGSLYAFMLFGRTWSFDPVESLGLLAWLAYGTLLHLHLFARWEGERLARWCLGVFVLLVISYRCIVYFPPSSTYHIFDMDRRLHVTGEDTGAAP